MSILPLFRIFRHLRNRTNQINLQKLHFIASARNHERRLQESIFPEIDTINSKNNLTLIVRHYAKGKDKKKDKGNAKVIIDENQMAELLNVESIKRQMEVPLSQMKENFIKSLSIRSSAGAIETLVVTLDGEEHLLQELAQISRKNPKTVILNMATFPQAIPEVLKSIQQSGLNLNPQQEGTTIYLPIPKVTKEHRENLSKNAKQLFIKCKESIRDVQMKSTKSLKKKNGVSEDLVRNIENQLKALGDKYIAEAEKILESKQKDLLGD